MTKRKNVDDVTSNIPGSDGQSRKYGMSTLAVHAGARPDPVTCLLYTSPSPRDGW